MIKIDYQVGIVGAGFGGIIAATQLQKAGITSFVIFEKQGGVGGVWKSNTYPGCACDIRANLYSIKDEPNPAWSHSYPKQPEILQYLEDVSEKHNLHPHIIFNREIDSAKFSEEEGAWTLHDQLGSTFRIRALLLATGPQRLPHMPVIEGQALFKGTQIHSANWENDRDFSGMRVAVIGTGASSVQITPALASKAAKLVVFQRTPAWVLPRWDHRHSRGMQWLYSTLPFTQRLSREVIYWFYELIGTSFRRNRLLHSLLTKVAIGKISKEVQNEETRRKLIPGYQLGCKRILVSDDFYPTFNLSHVTLETSAIKRLDENSIVTSEGTKYELEVVVYATGFRVADVENYIIIEGRNGKSLAKEWESGGAEAYKGITVSGYPNLCFILGPNSGLSHSSAVHVIESQMAYILQYLQYLLKHDGVFLDVKGDVQQQYNTKLQALLNSTVWNSGCSSWFLNKKMKNTVIYPKSTYAYRHKLSKFFLNDYEECTSRNTTQRSIDLAPTKI